MEEKGDDRQGEHQGQRGHKVGSQDTASNQANERSPLELKLDWTNVLIRAIVLVVENWWNIHHLDGELETLAGHGEKK